MVFKLRSAGAIFLFDKLNYNDHLIAFYVIYQG